MYERVSGVSGDSLSTSDTNLPQANCNEMIESMGFLRYNTKSCKPNDKGAIMLQISRNGYLHKGEWHKVSLKFFGYSLFAREKIIKGYKGGHN
ncbi:hypothetical protein [uncultured Helicobacter sp.]|uniref:hypothetical protein n=1 Tax=uncultured Helicobacter sp. TaxID=175537 RepID=UPI00374EC39B